MHAQGLAAANFTITAYVGKLAPLGTEVLGKTSINATMVPYAGRMRPHHAYAGTVSSGAWTYFRLTLGPSEVNANTPATVITVRHARPMEVVSLYLRHDEAPLDFQVLEYLKLDFLDFLVPANFSKFGDGRGGRSPSASPTTTLPPPTQRSLLRLSGPRLSDISGPVNSDMLVPANVKKCPQI